MAQLAAPTSALVDERVPWLDREMEAALASASPDLDLYRWARYHLGWYDERLTAMADEDRRRHGGKRLRGVLTLLACEALGGDGRAAAPAGAAIEFIHNFSLVHDDVEDHDEERRHRPTVWKLWGVPHAINVGSNMQAMVDVSVLRLAHVYPASTVIRVFEVITQAIVLMTEGQYLDMAAEDAAGMSLEAYYRMIGGKTAALIRAALWSGALLAGQASAAVEAFATFGWEFGLAFQCRDDYLGIWGDPALTGKPVGSDLIQGKRSLPVVVALAAASEGTRAGEQLRRALKERDVAMALEVMELHGVPERVRDHVSRHTQRALSALADAGGRSPYADGIRDIAEYALGRES